MTAMFKLPGFRSSRATRARVHRAVEQLTSESVDPGSSFDTLLHRLEHAVAENAVRQRRDTERIALLRAAFVAAPVALVLFEPHGEELLSSAQGETLFADSVTGVLVRSGLQSLARSVAALGAPAHDTVEVFGPPRRSLDLHAVAVDATAEPRHIVAFVEDTTERQLADAARRDLVTNISHELRTPVGAVALLAETLADEEDPSTIRHLASRLEFEAQRLTATLQDVLSLSRLETTGPGERQHLDLGQLVTHCVTRLRPNAELVGIDLTLGRIEEGVTVVGDGLLLMRAVDNLLENAIKYSDKGEPVQIEVRSVRTTDGAFAEFSVQDRGIGIPERERQRIFERFYRVDRARSRDTGGSGLGLAIVRHVAVSHDGQVTVDSTEGVGSTFRLRIPLVGPKPETAPNMPADEKVSGSA